MWGVCVAIDLPSHAVSSEKQASKFYILQPALERLAGRARPGALVVGRELVQVVP